MNVRTKPEIRVGQTWERVKDGTRVVITRIDHDWDDIYWRTPDGARRGSIFAMNFMPRYMLISEPDGES